MFYAQRTQAMIACFLPGNGYFMQKSDKFFSLQALLPSLPGHYQPQILETALPTATILDQIGHTPSQLYSPHYGIKNRFWRPPVF